MNNTMNGSIARELKDRFIAVCGEEFVFTDDDDLYGYGKDQTIDLHYSFDVLVKPASPEEIAGILKICNANKIPVTPRGGGSGVTGGALPVNGGVVISFERLNKIIHIDTVDLYVIAEAGVVTADLCKAVWEKGLYFPVAPTSKQSSFIGGNVAENSGSMRSCKYGTTSRYVLSLEVVLPTGEIIWTGANVSKNSTGLNMTQLFVGSEGILGIVTKVVFRLVPAYCSEAVILAGFESLENACNALHRIKRTSLDPAAVELICDNAIRHTAVYLNEALPLVNERIKAHILMVIEAYDDASLEEALVTFHSLLEDCGDENVIVATSSAEREKLMKLRTSIGSAIATQNLNYRDIDVCVPLSALFPYLGKVESICQHYKIRWVGFGHALDGNLHTMLLVEKATDLTGEIKDAIREIYQYAISVGGVLSGEHGIGLLQKEFMDLQFSPSHLSLMRGMKYFFDPNGILNPGKVI